MTWVKNQGVFTNKPWHKSWLVSKSRSESRCRSARWWLASRLSSEYHNRTDICLINTRNYCHRNKIYVLTSLLKQIYLQSAECARTYCTVNTVRHSCYHHREFTSRRTLAHRGLKQCRTEGIDIVYTSTYSQVIFFVSSPCAPALWRTATGDVSGVWRQARRTHEQRCGDCGFEMTSQLLPLTLSERTSHKQRNDAIWDLCHDLRRDSIESRWFSFVNTTWLGPGPSLKWDSVRVQAKSWVKSQVKTVSEYGPRLAPVYVIARCVKDWILELFSSFRALYESMHDIPCIVAITTATATPTMY